MTNQAILQSKGDNRYLAVVVPKNGLDFVIDKRSVYYSYRGINHIDLRPNKPLSIIGLLSEMTEEQAKEIVQSDEQGKYFEDYQVVRGDRFTALTAKESMTSLIESSGLTYTSEQDVLIIKIN